MHNHRILIVDDEAAMRRYLSRLIEPLGYEVTLAQDGEEALAFARQGSFDLIISDLKMPRMDGLTLLEKIRGDDIDVAFIILTAYSDLDTALSARDRFNIADFLVKPIHNQDQFLFDISSALNRRELEMQNRRLLDALTSANADLEQKVQERTQELIDKNIELARLSQFRADVLRILSHELRTPLAILSGYMTLNKAVLAGEEPQILAVLESALERLQGIVDKSIRQMREAEFTHFDLDIHPVEPETICATVVARINPLLTPRHVEIVLEIEPVGACRWDAARVESIIEELLINAVRASQDHTRIVLSLRKSGDRVHIAVKDYGLGIPPDDLTRIFEPFVTLGRADHHTSGLFAYRAQGVGLGLSIAKILAELHQGELNASANAGESGTTFRLSLPVRARPE